MIINDIMDCLYFCNIINHKTGVLFNHTLNNNYYIYKYENYLIVFNILTNIWGLLLDLNIVIESNNLNEIIYRFLYDTNRLAIVVYGENDIDEITRMMLNSSIK
jgi:hypothetical protein